MRNVLNLFLAAQLGRFGLFLPVCMGAGIVAYFALAFEPQLAWAWITAALTISLAAALWRWQLARACALCAAFAAGGFALACLQSWRAAPFVALPRHATEVAGLVTAAEALPAGQRVTIASPSLDGAPAIARSLRLRLRTRDHTDVRPGSVIRVRALLQPPAPPAFPGGWDAQRDAFFAALDGYGFAIGPPDILQSACAGWVQNVRGRIAARILRGLPGPDGGIAATLLTGIATAIPAEDRDHFAQSGLAHLLAVAGLHIGIVMGMVFFIARFGIALWPWAALRLPGKAIATLSALAAGLLYLLLTGAHVPILRSFAMACIAGIGVLTGRRAMSLRTLGVAAMLLMLADPYAVMGVSFQMSFAAVMSLMAGFAALRANGLAGGHRVLRPVLALLLTSLLAGTASLPYAAYHFGQATLFYVPANVVAVPLTAFWVMPWGLAALLLMPAGWEHAGLVPMGWGIAALRSIAAAVAGWPGASLRVPHMPAWGLVLFSAGLIWLCLWRGGVRMLGVVPLLAGACAGWLVRPPDMLIGPAARVIAVRLDGRVFAQAAPDADGFEQAAPALLWGQAVAPLAAAPGVRCDAAGCRVPWPGDALLVAQEMATPDCRARLIVSAAWLHEACPAARVLDRAWLNHAGAVTLWREGAVLTDAALRGGRPWVVRAAVALPMAQTE